MNESSWLRIGGAMSGRRRHPRYVMPNSEGTLRLVTDVVVRQDARGNLIAISDQPRKCGDVLSIELVTGAFARTPVRVVEVRPIVDQGSIRHWLRLVALEDNGARAQTVPETP